LISTIPVVMFQAQNRETKLINSTLKTAVSFNIIMTTTVTRSCFKNTRTARPRLQCTRPRPPYP